jgi:hypothetical protein
MSDVPLVIVTAKEGHLSGVWRAIMAATAGTAAILSLILLIRGFAVQAAVTLGASLGWMSLGISSLVFLALVPTFSTYLQSSAAGLMALDTVGLALLGFAVSATVKFWMNHPRTVTVGELAAFSIAQMLRDMRHRPLVARHLESMITEASVARNRKRNLRLISFVREGQFLAIFLGLAPIIAIFWRGNAANIGFFNLHMRDSPILGSLAFGIVCTFCIGLPMWIFMMAIHLHRVTGTNDEKRKVEWVWMAFMFNVVLLCVSQGVWLFELAPESCSS